MKILFIQPRVGIGDFILFLPFINAIAEQEKNSEIYILTKKRTVADQILIHDKKNSHGKINFILLKEIAEPVYDIQVKKELIKESFKYYLS